MYGHEPSAWPRLSWDAGALSTARRGKWRMVRTDRSKLIQIPREEGDLYERCPINFHRSLAYW
jgi:hypothetical protein